jgi:acyl-[acyl-carrier-protein]-phospholipid O-acyltransferase/long-chain-fatty-acid--[acyl-carrier-protein] ligase
MDKALKQANQAVRNGWLVCIFLETENARMEQMLSFKQLFEHIMKGLDAPIIPIYMDKSWGNVLDFQNNHYVWKMPPKIPSPVTIRFGSPLAAGASASKVAAAVRALRESPTLKGDI